jgi:hypothetical protein
LSFQSHVIDLIEKLGYKHIRVRDFISADYIDEEGTAKTGILCVDSTLVDLSTLINFYSQLLTQGYEHAFVFTTGLFTSEAIRYPDKIAENVELTLIDGVAIKKIDDKLKNYPHSLRYNVIWGFKRILDILWFSWFVWVSYGVFLECRMDRHAWIGVDILNGIFGGVFFIYPFTFYRQDPLKVINSWFLYLFILFIFGLLALLVSSIFGWTN